MPSRKKKLTGAAIEKRKKAGLGLGEGANYQPWLRNTDFSANSTCSVIPGWKHDRDYYLHSVGERRTFLCYEWSDMIVEVREQYPLALEDTVPIARMLGVRHPTIKGELMVITVDFLLFIRRGSSISIVARDFKRTKHLCKRRTLEKFEIVRLYFATRKIDWQVVTELDVPENCWRNVTWVHPRRDIRTFRPLTPARIREIGTALSDDIAGHDQVRLSTICDRVDVRLHLKVGTALAVSRFLIANKAWKVDMRDQRITPSVPMRIQVSNVEHLWSVVCHSRRCA